jgi:ATP-dependent DNA helicase PIF1
MRLAATDVLFVDEGSMVENNFLSRMEYMLQVAKRNRLPFGGIQIIVCGDFYQLSPVRLFKYCFTCGATTKERNNPATGQKTYQCRVCHREQEEADQWAFCSQAWKDANFINVNLTVNHRQNEEAFVNILQKLGRGDVLSQADRHLLFNHYCEVDGATHLFSKNDAVTAMNNEEFNRLPGIPRQYRCEDDFRWDQTNMQYRDLGKKDDGRHLNALLHHRYPEVLQLKQGQPVVLIINLDVEAGLVNGSQGIIVGFKHYSNANLPRSGSGIDSGSLRHGILPEDTWPHPLNVRGGDCAAYRHNLVKSFLLSENAGVDLPVVSFNNGKTITIFPDCNVTQLGDDPPYTFLSRTQLPLIAAWAMTIHKAQGMTMDKVIVHMDSKFYAGHADVALSRARTLRGLKLVGGDQGLDSSGPDPEVMEFMENAEWAL